MTTLNTNLDLVEFIKAVEKQKGRHIKRTLRDLEELNRLDPELRKIILDAMNDYTRSIYGLIGYTVER